MKGGIDLKNKKYITLSEYIYLISFILPFIAFIIIPSPNALDNNLSFIEKIIVFIIYMIPTMLFFFCISEIKKNNKVKKRINMYILKKHCIEFLLFFLNGIVGIYLIKENFLYIGIPILLIALELIFIRYFNFTYYYKEIYNNELKDNKYNRLDIEELKKYNKWDGFLSSIMTGFCVFIPILVLMGMPLSYFNILGFNIITTIVYLILYVIIFILIAPGPQILDCKLNSFVRCQGTCIGYGQSGKGVGGYHTVKLSENNNQEITFSSERPIFRNGENVLLIIGVHSKQVIGFHKVL